MGVLPFDPDALPTPYYIIDEGALRRNLEILKDVRDRAECKILLAQKAFSAFALYPLIGEYLDGTTASGLFEARLGKEEMGKENHIFSAAYSERDFDEICTLCGHIVFNSVSQWERFGARALAAGAECGLRINPEHSTQDHAIYDPCACGSRLGIVAAHFPAELPEGISGLHFHTLCEQNFDALDETLHAAEERFGKYFRQVKWLNFGGGHHITRADYDAEGLIACIRRVRETYDVEVYLEPGEAVALNAGYLVSTVLDVTENGLCNVILDTSAACHMPDVLEMPYRPPVLNAGQPGEKAFTCRLGGPTCLAGDVIGDYSFDAPLKVGDKVIFGDMAIYSMVKNNTFNGMPLPAIALAKRSGEVRLLRSFGYGDFKRRLS